LANLTLKNTFFRNWKICEGGCQRQSLRSFDVYNLSLVNSDASLELPPQTDIDEFFSLNTELKCLSFDPCEEFPGSWLIPVGKHCLKLEYFEFADNGLPLVELEALLTSLRYLKYLPTEVKTNALVSERIAVLSRTESLCSLHLSAEESTILELEPTLQLSTLRQLQISSPTADLTEVSCRVLCSPNLKSITLRRWNQELVDSIAAQCPLLEELVMAGCGETLESKPNLSSVIQRCRQLRRLTVSAPKYDGKVLNDLIEHRAQLSSLTIGNYNTPKTMPDQESLVKFLRGLPLHFSSLSMCVDEVLAEVILHELIQRPELDLRWINLGPNRNTKLCVHRWTDKLKAVFPNLYLN
jgi:hypothetical protein